MNLDHDMVINNEGCEGILLHDISGDVLDWYSHIFEPVHRGVEIKVFNINNKVRDINVRNDTIEMQLNSLHFSSGSSDDIGVIDAITSYSEANTLGVILMGL